MLLYNCACSDPRRKQKSVQQWPSNYGGKTFVPLHDLQGNIVMLLTPQGEVAESTGYDAFGNSLSSFFSENPWGVASKRLNETGLIYYGRRYYAPHLGRWLTPDPLGLSAGPNLYALKKQQSIDPLLISLWPCHG